MSKRPIADGVRVAELPDGRVYLMAREVDRDGNYIEPDDDYDEEDEPTRLPVLVLGWRGWIRMREGDDWPERALNIGGLWRYGPKIRASSIDPNTAYEMRTEIQSLTATLRQKQAVIDSQQGMLDGSHSRTRELEREVERLEWELNLWRPPAPSQQFADIGEDDAYREPTGARAHWWQKRTRES